MPSKVSIANMALTHIGANNTIEALTEQSPEAAVCNVWYETCAEETLKAFDWSFARARLAMALHGEDAPDDWAYRYQYPSDCLAARYIVHPSGNSGDAITYEVAKAANGTRCILTNLESATLVYTARVTEPEFFTPHFVITLSYNLAQRIAYALTKKRPIQDDMRNYYAMYLGSASAEDANESIPAAPRDSEFIRARA